MKKRGYTLVELLVVIAVIAILAAMLAPVLLQAKEAARMRVCCSNLRQLGFAITRYFDDWDGYSLPVPPSGYKNKWVLNPTPLVPKYIPGARTELCGPTILRSPPQPKSMWVCPGDVKRGNGLDAREQPFWFWCGSSYIYPGPTAYMKSTANPPDPYDPVATPLKPLSWRNHKRDLLLADVWFDFHNGRRVPRTEDQMRKVVPPTMVSAEEIKCINVLFLDLHVQIATPSQRLEYINNTVIYDNPYR